MASRTVWLSLVIAMAGCAAGVEDPEVAVSEQDATEVRCPVEPDSNAAMPAEPTNGQRGPSDGPLTGVPGGGPGSTGTPTSDSPSDANGRGERGNATPTLVCPAAVSDGDGRGGADD